MKSIVEKYVEESNSLISKEFVAPIIDIVKIKNKGLIYSFNLKNIKSKNENENENKNKWGIIKPISSAQCAFIREAEFFEIEKYLENFPKFKLILVKKIKDRSWIAIPFNLSDAKQRIHSLGDTVIVHIVKECSLFDHIISRFDGFNFWYESIDEHISYEIIDRMRKILLNESISKKGLSKEQKVAINLYIKLDKELYKKQLEDKIKKSLSVAKAELKSYSEIEDNIKITWESEGEQYSSLLRKKDLTVVSAGICLSGRDSDFDLTSIVSVIKDR